MKVQDVDISTQDGATAALSSIDEALKSNLQALLIDLGDVGAQQGAGQRIARDLFGGTPGIGDGIGDIGTQGKFVRFGPVESLREGAERVRDGDFSVDIPVDDSTELGLLQAGTPLVIMGAVLLLSGVFRSIGFSGYNSLQFADISGTSMAGRLPGRTCATAPAPRPY